MPIVTDLPGVIPVACHKQIQKRGFPAAGCAHNSIFLSCIKSGIDIMQNVTAYFITKGHMFQCDPAIQLLRNERTFVPDMIFQGISKLIDQCSCRLSGCKLFRQFANGGYYIRSQVNKKDQYTRCDPPAGQSKPRSD